MRPGSAAGEEIGEREDNAANGDRCGNRCGGFVRNCRHAEQAAAIPFMLLVVCIARMPVRRAIIGMGVRGVPLMRMRGTVGMNVCLGGCLMHMRFAMRISQAMRGGVREGQGSGWHENAERIEADERKRRPPP